MSYLHIPNLYKQQEIFLFRQCFAMEKIDGTSAHISYGKESGIHFFSGGASHDPFVALFNAKELQEKIESKCLPFPCYIYGEAYGGKMQKMARVYGKELKFIVFEVRLGDCWLNVPDAEDFATSLGLEFVYYKLIPTDVDMINVERDALSEQAKRNGCGDYPREGVVLRPLIELTMNNGKRIIVKHKTELRRETANPRSLDLEKIKILTDSKAIANEWVTRERLNHILGRFDIECAKENIGKIIPLMIEDILREGIGEIIDSREARAEIARLTSSLIKERVDLSVQEVGVCDNSPA